MAALSCIRAGCSSRYHEGDPNYLGPAAVPPGWWQVHIRGEIRAACSRECAVATGAKPGSFFHPVAVPTCGSCYWFNAEKGRRDPLDGAQHGRCGSTSVPGYHFVAGGDPKDRMPTKHSHETCKFWGGDDRIIYQGAVFCEGREVASALSREGLAEVWERDRSRREMLEKLKTARVRCPGCGTEMDLNGSATYPEHTRAKFYMEGERCPGSGRAVPMATTGPPQPVEPNPALEVVAVDTIADAEGPPVEPSTDISKDLPILCHDCGEAEQDCVCTGGIGIPGITMPAEFGVEYGFRWEIANDPAATPAWGWAIYAASAERGAPPLPSSPKPERAVMCGLAISYDRARRACDVAIAQKTKERQEKTDRVETELAGAVAQMRAEPIPLPMAGPKDGTQRVRDGGLEVYIEGEWLRVTMAVPNPGVAPALATLEPDPADRTPLEAGEVVFHKVTGHRLVAVQPGALDSHEIVTLTKQTAASWETEQRPEKVAIEDAWLCDDGSGPPYKRFPRALLTRRAANCAVALSLLPPSDPRVGVIRRWFRRVFGG